MSDGGPILYFPGKRDPLVRVYERAKDGGARLYFSVKWRDPDSGLMVKRDRSTKAKAKELAMEVCEGLEARMRGLKATRLTSDDRALLALARRVPFEKLTDFVREWESIGKRRTVDEWRLEWLGIAERDVSVATFREYRKKTGAFQRAFAGRYLDEVTPAEIEGWRDGFVKWNHPDPEVLRKSKRTANNYVGPVSTMYKAAKMAGALPDGVEVAPARVRAFRKVKSDEVAILSVEEVARLLGNLPKRPKFALYVLLSVFMPFRPSDITIPRGGRTGLLWEHFRWDLDEPAVDLPASVAGKGRSRLIVIPPVLVEWLLPYRKASGPVSRSDASNAIRKHYGKMIKAGELPPLVADIFRHTVISHMLAKTRNEVSWVADQAGNSEREIRSSYKSPRSQSDGDLYFSLSQDRVLELTSETSKVIDITNDLKLA